MDIAREDLIGHARTNAINATDGAGTAATTPPPLLLLQPLDLASVSSNQTRRKFVAVINAAALLTLAFASLCASCKTVLNLAGLDSLLTIYN